MAAGQVEHPALRPTAHLGGIEEQQVGVVAGLQGAARTDAEQAGRVAGEPPHGLLDRQHTALAHPVAEEMQAEAGIVEEGKVRTGVGKRLLADPEVAALLLGQIGASAAT